MIIDLQATKSSRAYVNEGHAVCFKYLSLQDVCSGVYKKNISAPFKQKYKETQRKTDTSGIRNQTDNYVGVVAICKSKVITLRNGKRLETALRNAFG